MLSIQKSGKQWAFLCLLLLGKRALGAKQAKTNLRKLQENPQIPIGFQSGPDPGATFGGKVLYRPNSNRLYVTGASYGKFFQSTDESQSNTNAAGDVANCFLGIAELPSASNPKEPFKWLHAQQWDTIAPEACNAIHVDKHPENLPENNTRIEEKIYLVGYTSPNGLMENMRVQSAFPSEQYGMILDLDIVTKEAEDDQGLAPFTTTFWGGRLLQDGPVQYPVDMTIDEEGYLYVASMQSWNANPTQEVTADQARKLVVDPTIKPLGAEYNMLVQQFVYDNPGYDDGIGLPKDPANVEMQTTIIDNWRKPFGPASGTGGVSVSGIQYMGGLLVLVGNTAGHSQVFGNDIQAFSNRTDTIINGFITKITPDSGTYFQFVADNGADGENIPLHKRSSRAIMSIDFKDDYITGMCSSPEADPNHFYIVGTTEGQIDREMDMFVEGEVHAFIMKVDLWTLSPVWTKQIGGDPMKKDGVRGVSCAVTPDGQDVYLAGVVENGGSLSLWEQKSFGGEDIFIFQAKAEDGRLQFIRQIGTAGNDSIAPGGLATDQFGNAILMGQTDGSLYRSREYDQESEKSEDLFIMTVIRDTGDYKEPEIVDSSATTPVETDASSESEEPATVIDDQPPRGSTGDEKETKPPDENPSSGLVEPKPANPNKPVQSYHASGEIDRTKETAPSNGEKEATEHNDGQRYGLLVFFVLVAFVGAAAGLFAYKKVLDSRDRPTERDHVLQYLQDFDVDDIDLKHSATGGWHCSYTNDLAHGINARAASRGEGLFGLSSGYSYKPSTKDPLLADTRDGGEISFEDEHDRDDISSIGSGATGRNSTRSGLLDSNDEPRKSGRNGPPDLLL